MGAVAEPHQRLREMPVSVHGDLSGDVVENVRLRQVIELVGPADRDGGWELAIAQAVKKDKRRNVPAYRLGLKARERFQKAVHIGQPWNVVRIETQRANAFKEV